MNRNILSLQLMFTEQNVSSIYKKNLNLNEIIGTIFVEYSLKIFCLKEANHLEKWGQFLKGAVSQKIGIRFKCN